MQTIALVSQKGGQGKSTVCANLAAACREAGLRIAVIDLDPQASLTDETFLPVDGDGNNVERDAVFTPDFVIPVSDFLGIKLPSEKEFWPERQSTELLFVKADHLEMDERQFKLATFKANMSALEAAGFDFVFIDTQGSLAGLTRQALAVADSCLIPFQFGGYDIAAIPKTIGQIERIRAQHNPTLTLLGMLACKVRTSSPRVMEALRDAKGGASLVLPFHLADRTAVTDATEMRRPVWRGARTGAQRDAAKEWKEMAHSVLSRVADAAQ